MTVATASVAGTWHYLLFLVTLFISFIHLKGKEYRGIHTSGCLGHLVLQRYKTLHFRGGKTSILAKAISVFATSNIRLSPKCP